MKRSKTKRIGKLYLSREYVMQDVSAYKLFTTLQFVPLRVELIAHIDEFEMIGISPMFDPVPEGAMLLEYKIVTVFKDGQEIGFKVEKVEWSRHNGRH